MLNSIKLYIDWNYGDLWGRSIYHLPMSTLHPRPALDKGDLTSDDGLWNWINWRFREGDLSNFSARANLIGIPNEFRQSGYLPVRVEAFRDGAWIGAEGYTEPADCKPKTLVQLLPIEWYTIPYLRAFIWRHVWDWAGVIVTTHLHEAVLPDIAEFGGKPDTVLGDQEIVKQYMQIQSKYEIKPVLVDRGVETGEIFILDSTALDDQNRQARVFNIWKGN